MEVSQIFQSGNYNTGLQFIKTEVEYRQLKTAKKKNKKQQNDGITSDYTLSRHTSSPNTYQMSKFLKIADISANSSRSAKYFNSLFSFKRAIHCIARALWSQSAT